MALTTKKSITLTGTSKVTVENDGTTTEVAAVSMTANIAENGNSNISTVIINQEQYDANKATCRADMDAFTAAVREIEDEE